MTKYKYSAKWNKKKREEVKAQKALTVQRFYSEPVLNPLNSLYEVVITDAQEIILDILMGSTVEDVLGQKYQYMDNVHAYQKRREQFKKSVGKGCIVHQYEELDLKSKVIDEFIQMKISGEELHDITSTLSAKYGLSPVTINIYSVEAYAEMKRLSAIYIEQTLETHLRRYEEIYKWYYQRGKFNRCGKILKFKEKMMGLGEATGVIVINNYATVQDKDDSLYDFNKLKPEQAKRLTEIFKRAQVRVPQSNDAQIIE